MNTSYAPLILRIGVGIVFLLLGVDKHFHPERWIIYVEGALLGWVRSVAGIELHSFLRAQGVLEALVGALLLAGFATRYAAALNAAMLAGIILMLGFDPIAIRDFGLLGAVVCLALVGGGRLSVDAHLHLQVRVEEKIKMMRRKTLAWLP